MSLTSTRKKILVVDDENLIRWSLGASLEEEDFEVYLAESAERAIDLTAEIDFDLIITDYRMAKVDGLQFTEHVKSVSPDTKVIILTAYGTRELRSQAAELGVEAFIDKPFDVSHLCREVRRQLHLSA